MPQSPTIINAYSVYLRKQTGTPKKRIKKKSMHAFGGNLSFKTLGLTKQNVAGTL